MSEESKMHERSVEVDRKTFTVTIRNPSRGEANRTADQRFVDQHGIEAAAFVRDAVGEVLTLAFRSAGDLERWVAGQEA